MSIVIGSGSNFFAAYEQERAQAGKNTGLPKPRQSNKWTRSPVGHHELIAEERKVHLLS